MVRFWVAKKGTIWRVIVDGAILIACVFAVISTAQSNSAKNSAERAALQAKSASEQAEKTAAETQRLTERICVNQRHNIEGLEKMRSGINALVRFSVQNPSDPAQARLFQMITDRYFGTQFKSEAECDAG